MAASLSPAFVLHSRPYRESSLLVDLLTRDAGRICLVARGARKSRRSGTQRLQPFVPLQVGWRGRGELPTLAGVEAEGPALLAHGSRTALVALYLNELLLRLTAREDPHPVLFASYYQALLTLAQDIVEPALRRFEMALLNELGYGLQLHNAADTGEPVVAEHYYRYDLETGPVAEQKVPAAGLVSGDTLLALAADALTTPQHLREAKSLLSRVVGQHLGSRPLQTRELLRELN